MLAQNLGPPVVVIGGGFGGAACARALLKADPRLTVTLVEANSTYTAMPHSNAVIEGLAELSEQQFGYDKIKATGIDVALSAARPQSTRTSASLPWPTAANCPTSGW